MDALLKLLARLLEPLIDYVNTWATVVVSLNAQCVFKEDGPGVWHAAQGGSAVILVINNGREPIKVHDVGITFSDGQRLSCPFILEDNEKLPRTVEGKEHAWFLVKRDILLQVGWPGLLSIKYVYFTDSTFREYKSRVPRINKLQIAASLENRIAMV